MRPLAGWPVQDNSLIKSGPFKRFLLFGPAGRDFEKTVIFRWFLGRQTSIWLGNPPETARKPPGDPHAGIGFFKPLVCRSVPEKSLIKAGPCKRFLLFGPVGRGFKKTGNFPPGPPINLRSLGEGALSMTWISKHGSLGIFFPPGRPTTTRTSLGNDVYRCHGFRNLVLLD